MGICAAVKFEHSCNWQSMPEYACGADGPAGGVLSALEQALGGPRSAFAQERLAAASRLEEVMHEAAEMGQPMPPLHSSFAPPVASAPPLASAPPYVPHPDDRPSWGGAPAAHGHDYSHHGVNYGGPQYGGPQSQYGVPQYDGPQYGDLQYGHAPQCHPGGPTLLQSQPQHQGMSTGGKVALAATGGVAAGVAGYAIATHMDGIGGAFGDAAEGVGHFAAGAVEDVGDFVGDIGGGFADVGHFAAGAVEDVGEFVEDMF